MSDYPFQLAITKAVHDERNRCLAIIASRQQAAAYETEVHDFGSDAYSEAHTVAVELADIMAAIKSGRQANG